jgi:hypothetical protein
METAVAVFNRVRLYGRVSGRISLPAAPLIHIKIFPALQKKEPASFRLAGNARCCSAAQRTAR